MPLTSTQAEMLSTIAANRSPENYVAGATVLHRFPDTPRFSEDVDLFHDLEDSVAQSAEMDAATLRAAGHAVSWLLRTPTFHRAVVTAAGQELKIEWAHDSAFRFCAPSARYLSVARCSGMGRLRQGPRIHAGVPPGLCGPARRLYPSRPRPAQFASTARFQGDETAVARRRCGSPYDGDDPAAR